MRKLFLLLTLVSTTQCQYYDHANEYCKVKEYYNYEGVEFERCYK